MFWIFADWERGFRLGQVASGEDGSGEGWMQEGRLLVLNLELDRFGGELWSGLGVGD